MSCNIVSVATVTIACINNAAASSSCKREKFQRHLIFLQSNVSDISHNQRNTGIESRGW